MAKAKLDARIFGYAAAIISAAGMGLLGILGNLGLYTGAVQQMKGMHMFFSLSITGIITGIIEGAIIGFIFAYAFARIYNKLV